MSRLGYSPLSPAIEEAFETRFYLFKDALSETLWLSWSGGGELV